MFHNVYCIALQEVMFIHIFSDIRRRLKPSEIGDKIYGCFTLQRAKSGSFFSRSHEKRDFFSRCRVKYTFFFGFAIGPFNNDVEISRVLKWTLLLSPFEINFCCLINYTVGGFVFLILC